MKGFLLMLSFFTRLPVRYTHEFRQEVFIRGIKYTPAVGVILGMIMWGAYKSLLWMDVPVMSVLLVLAYIWLTGGLHIDGLSDTCDGIFSSRSRERALEIMKDSRVGAFGVIAIITIVAVYLILFCYIGDAIFLMPVIGRCCGVISCIRGKYVREDGMGKAFVENCGPLEIGIAAIVPLALGLYFYGWPVAIAVLASFGFTLAQTAWIRSKLGGTTGDTIGFSIETSQAFFLFAAYSTGMLTM